MATKEIEIKKEEKKTQHVALPLVLAQCHVCESDTIRTCGYGCNKPLCINCEKKHNQMHLNLKQVVCVNHPEEKYYVPSDPNNSEQYDICTVSIQMIAKHLQSNPDCKMVDASQLKEESA